MIMLKVFRFTVVFLVAIISATLFVVLLTAALSSLPLPMISHTDGISAVTGGVSERWVQFAFLFATLISVCFLYWRRRRKSR